MKRFLISASLAFFIGCAFAQSPEIGPMTLSLLLKGLADPFLADVPELTEQIQRRGIDFDLEKQLGEILSAASKGKRNPDEVASLIAASLNACQSCRSRMLAPMTTEELRNMQRGVPVNVVMEEARVRGVKELEISEASANALRSMGANDALVNLLIPDDRIKTIPLDGDYNALELKHAEDYDPSAAAGWLKITTDLPASSQTEFVFNHTALFCRVVKGIEAQNVTAYFNKPAPRNTKAELVEFKIESEKTSAVEEKRSGLPGPRKSKTKVAAPPIEATYLGADGNGRNMFRLMVTNNGTVSQPLSFFLRWRVKTAKEGGSVP